MEAKASGPDALDSALSLFEIDAPKGTNPEHMADTRQQAKLQGHCYTSAINLAAALANFGLLRPS